MAAHKNALLKERLLVYACVYWLFTDRYKSPHSSHISRSVDCSLQFHGNVMVIVKMTFMQIFRIS